MSGSGCVRVPELRLLQDGAKKQRLGWSYAAALALGFVQSLHKCATLRVGLELCARHVLTWSVAALATMVSMACHAGSYRCGFVCTRPSCQYHTWLHLIVSICCSMTCAGMGPG